MMFIVCNNCRLALRVTGDANEVKDLSERTLYPCPACGCQCTAAPFVDNAVLQAKEVHELSPLEAFLALEGQGLPGERECAAEIVSSILTSQKVKAVKARSVPNTGRSVVDELTLEDGTTLFLGSSVHGALVYRIRKPHSYVEKSNGS